jgi:integration host factor subunit alpha
MTLTKSHIIDSLNNRCGFSKTQSIKITDEALGIIKKTLESGEDVLISGFGKFSISDKNERRGRNPSTGNELMLDARRVVSFKCSSSLKGKISSIE